MRALGILLVSGALVLALPSRAQTPDDALAGQLATVCAGAGVGSELASRCADIFSGGPGAVDIAARGNFLGEIPGQGRAATRDGAPGDSELRSDLGGGWSAFLSADLGRVKRRDGINESPFDGDTGTISAGVDWAVTTNLRFGLLANHASDDLDFVASDGSMRTRFTGVLALASWNVTDQWSIDAYAGHLSGDYRLRRAVEYTLPTRVAVASVASASPDATRDLAGAGVTWSLPVNGWDWQLGAGLDWQNTGIEAFSETGGAGFAILLAAREVESRRGRLDVTLARNISTSWGVWQPLARLGLRHEYANPSRPVNVRFVQDTAGTPVRFDTDDADTGWGEAGLGAVFVFTGGHSAFVEYRQRFGHDFLQERILAAGWRIELP